MDARGSGSSISAYHESMRAGDIEIVFITPEARVATIMRCQEVEKLLGRQNTAGLNLGFGMFRPWLAANHGLASPKEGAFSDGTCLDCTSCSGCTCSVHHQANYLL